MTDMTFRLFLFLVLCAASGRVLAVSYTVGGTCYSDSPSQLAGFQSMFPTVDGSKVNVVTSSSINATGLITFVTQSRAFSTATWTVNPSSTVQLATCTSGLIAGGRLEFFLSALTAVCCFLFGFRIGNGFYDSRIVASS